MTALAIIGVIFFLTWDDPNPVGTVAGYHVYRVEHTGTGTMIRHRLNAELIPWVPDTEDTPSWDLVGVFPGDELRGTAVGVPYPYHPNTPGMESEMSDDFWTVPYPPAAPVGARLTTEP